MKHGYEFTSNTGLHLSQLVQGFSIYSKEPLFNVAGAQESPPE